MARILILAAYRGQSEIEACFRLMNDWDYMHFRPVFHWTDQKIRVHAFYCMLALRAKKGDKMCHAVGADIFSGG